MNEKRIRLAVTGLSRSGKTVFITSLIQNLIALGEGRDTLPLITTRLDNNGRSRLRKVTIEPASVQTIPYFDFQAKLEALSRPDAIWPPRTEDLSETSISLEIEREGLWQKFGTRRVRLDILDYPGEWLLDLPLLDQSVRGLVGRHDRASVDAAMLPKTAPFLDYLRGLSADGPAEEAMTRRGHALYKALLFELRNDLGLRYLQPGRFLCPGPFGDAPFLWFFPMPGTGPSLPPGSLGKLLEARFETYKREIRSGFFDTYFKDFDRQIMLVDVLGCLYAGKTAFEDTAAAIHDLTVALRDGWGTWSRGRPRRGFGRQRPAVAAVPAGHRGDVRGLGAVRHAAGGPCGDCRHQGRPCAGTRPAGVETAARPPREVGGRRDRGQPCQRHLSRRVIDPLHRGRDAADRRAGGSRGAGGAGLRWAGATILAGSDPGGGNSRLFLGCGVFRAAHFRPPRIEPSGNEGIRHLGLDEVLDVVIGDRL